MVHPFLVEAVGPFACGSTAAFDQAKLGAGLNRRHAPTITMTKNSNTSP
jgi:hypothetical protein